jgi:hypothetical protein
MILRSEWPIGTDQGPQARDRRLSERGERCIGAARHAEPEPPATIFSFSFWSTISTVRSISALGMPS